MPDHSFSSLTRRLANPLTWAFWRRPHNTAPAAAIAEADRDTITTYDWSTGGSTALRDVLHRRGSGLVVVERPVPGGTRCRRVDILLRGARIAVLDDKRFWRSCPEHSHSPETNTNWLRLNSPGIARRDRDNGHRTPPTDP